MNGSRARAGTWLALTAILLVAAGLRLHHLDHRTLIQGEIYTPGIDLPAYATEPRARHSAIETIVGTYRQDVHPPGYYLWMVGWSRAFGTDLAIMRLPSVAWAVMSIGLLFALARREHGDRVALGAAALLTLNGLHLYYSQLARNWMPAYLLAVASVWLLLMLERRPSRAAAAAYVGVSAAGLWAVYPFWLFFIAQGLYVLFGRPPIGRALELLRLQATAAVLGAPLVAFVLVQGPRSHDIASQTWSRLLDVVAFNGMIEREGLVAWQEPIGSLAYWIVAALGALLLVLGSRNRSQRGSEPGRDDEPGAEAGNAPYAHSAAPLLVATAVSLAGVATLRVLDLASIRKLLPAVLFGVSVVAVWWAIRWRWSDLVPWIERIRVQRFVRAVCGDPITAAVVLVPAFLLLVSLVSKPVIVPRALLLVAPFCMLLVARGVAGVPGRAAKIALAAVLLVTGVLSARYALTDQRPHVRNYAGFASDLMPRLQPGDMLIVENGWWAQPIFYYLDFHRYPAAAPEDVLARLAADPDAVEAGRLWIFAWGPSEHIEERSSAALLPFEAHGYSPVEKVDARMMRAILVQRSQPQT